MTDAALALPVSGTVTGDAGSVLLMVSAPAMAPSVEGVYVTLTEHEEPALTVVMPQVLAMVKSFVAAKARPSTGVVLTLLSVSESVRLLPRATSPKARDAGDTTSCGCVPVPESDAVSGSGVAEVLIATEP